jgi:uncharacterized integral membrane protein
MTDGEHDDGSEAETSEPPGGDRTPTTRPTAEGEGTVYRGTGVSATLIVGTIVAILAIILAVQNTETTTVEVFRADYSAPLVVVILAAAIAGVLLDEVAGLFWRRRRRRHLAERAELRRFRRSRKLAAK